MNCVIILKLYIIIKYIHIKFIKLHNVYICLLMFISIILAFMNILPIPALDGGHVVFLLYEIITGREAPQKVLEYAQYVGFIFLLGLILYANGNDLVRWIFG